MDRSANELLSDPNWVVAERYTDSEYLDDPEIFGDLRVTFSGTASHDYEDLVLATVPVIRRVAGVTRAEDDDRGVILVWGDKVDPEALVQAVTQAWQSWLE